MAIRLDPGAFERYPAPMKLSELPLLVVDVQTTGASPLGAGLLEVGWQRLGPHGGGAVSLPCRLPPGVPLPPRIRRITGIGDEDRTGREATPREIWWLLSAAGGGGPVPQVPLLAHYALFERRWLRHMAALAGVEWEPDVICTMELARRVFPGLPGKGLRSVAGYLGFSLSRHRRAADHLRATAFVWGRMLPLLAEEGVETLGELRRFLKAPPTGGRRLTALDRRRLSRLPRRPGVYRLLAADGRVLYVGKAACLRSRVGSYFAPGASGGKNRALASQAARVEETVCDTPFSAALLEACEIHRLDPPYNTAMRPPREDCAWYCPPDFRTLSPEPEEGWLGPFPRRETVIRMGGLVRAALRGRPGRRLGRWLRGHLERRGPLREDTLRQGLEGLLARAEGRTDIRDAAEWADALLALGERELAERAIRAAADGEGEEAESGPEGEPAPAGPEEVEGMLVSVAASAARGVRMGLLCRMLGSSVLSWKGPHGSGRIATARWRPEEGWPEGAPAEIGPALRCRLARVAAGEMRRLLRAGARVELSPEGGVSPGASELRRLVGLPPAPSHDDDGQASLCRHG